MSAKTSPLISVITPAYNAEHTLAATIESVLAQTFKMWEMHIVIDHKSKDKTLDLARSFSTKDGRIQVHSEPFCTGVSANRNFAIEKSQGAYIAFLDADDRWLPEKLEKQLRFMESRNVIFSYHSYSVIDEKGLHVKNRLASDCLGFYDLLKNNSIGCLTVMIRRDLLNTHRFKNIRHEDLLLWLELLKSGAKAYGLSDTLAKYQLSPHSMSANKLKAAQWRWHLYREMGIPRIKSIFYMTCYIATALWKRI